MNYKDEDILFNWFSKRDLSLNTQDVYTYAMRDYCNFIDKTPSQLLDEAETEQEEIQKMRNRQIEGYLSKFKAHLKQMDQSPNTLRIKLKAVISFYRSYDITVPDMTFKKGEICLPENRGRLPTKDEISLMMSSCEPRNRTMISLMAMTGMSQAEVRHLTFKQVLDAVGKNNIEELIESKHEICEDVHAITIVRQKVGYKYITFIPPESMEELINYITVRVNHPKKEKKPQGVNDRIFVNRFGGRLSGKAVSASMRRIGIRLGFESEFGSYGFWRPHGMRKYFISTIINKTGDNVLAHFCAGHKVDEITGAYWYPDEADLKQRYLKSLPYLSIRGVQVREVDAKGKEIAERHGKIQQKAIENVTSWRQR